MTDTQPISLVDRLKSITLKDLKREATEYITKPDASRVDGKAYLATLDAKIVQITQTIAKEKAASDPNDVVETHEANLDSLQDLKALLETKLAAMPKTAEEVAEEAAAEKRALLDLGVPEVVVETHFQMKAQLAALEAKLAESAEQIANIVKPKENPTENQESWFVKGARRAGERVGSVSGFGGVLRMLDQVVLKRGLLAYPQDAVTSRWEAKFGTAETRQQKQEEKKQDKEVADKLKDKGYDPKWESLLDKDRQKMIVPEADKVDGYILYASKLMVDGKPFIKAPTDSKEESRKIATKLETDFGLTDAAVSGYFARRAEKMAKFDDRLSLVAPAGADTDKKNPAPDEEAKIKITAALTEIYGLLGLTEAEVATLAATGVATEGAKLALLGTDYAEADKKNLAAAALAASTDLIQLEKIKAYLQIKNAKPPVSPKGPGSGPIPPAGGGAPTPPPVDPAAAKAALDMLGNPNP